jgi:hypothetical protein
MKQRDDKTNEKIAKTSPFVGEYFEQVSTSVQQKYVLYSTLLHLLPLRFQCVKDAGIEPRTAA